MDLPASPPHGRVGAATASTAGPSDLVGCDCTAEAAGLTPGGPSRLRAAAEAADCGDELPLDAPDESPALLLVVVEVLRPELAALSAPSGRINAESPAS